MESTPKQGHLTNKDFRELIKNHIPTKREQTEEITRDVKKAKKEKKTNTKKYDKKKRDDSLELLLSRYRDRARERREGKNPDYLSISDVTEPIAYHAVGPDAKHNIRLEERRKQLIQESKYLGGDMAHTHLVKGLDFALLNKVRSEIEAKTKEEVPAEPVEEEETGFKSQMAKNIDDILFKSKPVEKNPLFAPGKMCYLVDLKEEKMDTDVPTTVIRSRILNTDYGKTMITTDAIIDKIREVLHGTKEDIKHKKLRKMEPLPENLEPKKEDKKREIRNVEKVGASKTDAMLKKLLAEPTGYAECYPGAAATLEEADDSEQEDVEAENAARAAYQFGLKVAAGRRTRQAERVKKTSLDREWASIKNRLQL